MNVIDEWSYVIIFTVSVFISALEGFHQLLDSVVKCEHFTTISHKWTVLDSVVKCEMEVVGSTLAAGHDAISYGGLKSRTGIHQEQRLVKPINKSPAFNCWFCYLWCLLITCHLFLEQHLLNHLVKFKLWRCVPFMELYQIHSETSINYRFLAGYCSNKHEKL